ncbi:MAG: glycosyl transferase [Rhodobacterales bacterium]|nr:MAG: glycosyl transferase [Rhodobacterales bacterium]
MPDPICFHISTNARRSARAGWGDTQFSEGLARDLEARGHQVRLFYRGEAPKPSGQRDVVLRIIGPHLDDPVPGLPNILWIISPPNLAPLATLARYQAVFTCAPLLTRRLRDCGIPAQTMMQGTDIHHFRPDRWTGPPDIPVLFVGSRASRAPRGLVATVAQMGFDLKVWGRGWKGVLPDEMLGGEYLDYEGLADAYARARVILNDHMPHMARAGMMSNRSFDAIASGATVISDEVLALDDLPYVEQVRTPDELRAALTRALKGPPPDAEERARRHDLIRERFSLAQRAETFVEAADSILAQEAYCAPAFAGAEGARQIPGARPSASKLSLSDLPDEQPPDGAALLTTPEQVIDWAGGEQGPAWLSDPALLDHLPEDVRPDLLLERPAEALLPDDPALEKATARAAWAILRMAALAERRGRLGVVTLATPAPPGLLPIHPLMSALRECREALSFPLTERAATVIGAHAETARRVIEVLGASHGPYPLSLGGHIRRTAVLRAVSGDPLFAHDREGHDRNAAKPHLRLWPRKARVQVERPLGVFLHLYYADLAPAFRDRLAMIDAPVQVYISTDAPQKAAELRETFPEADIRMMENRGRDVYPKLYGFADVYDRHDLVLHLHGKKSRHSAQLDGWLEDIFDSLLPSRDEINRILSLFQTVPDLGIVSPLVHKTLLSAAHWGDNRPIAEELAARMGIMTGLPGNDALRFPVGSMMWARTAALRPLLDLRLRPEHFPPEAGQLDGTTAHAIERLLGVCCQAQGYRLLPVTGQGNARHHGYALKASRNSEVREALAAGRV